MIEVQLIEKPNSGFTTFDPANIAKENSLLFINILDWVKEKKLFLKPDTYYECIDGLERQCFCMTKGIIYDPNYQHFICYDHDEARKIGAGGMGIVHRASGIITINNHTITYTANESIYALKKLKITDINIEREAKLSQKIPYLQSTFLAKSINSNVNNESILVMPLIPGENLVRFFTAAEKHLVSTFLEIAMKILFQTELLHLFGVVNTDIKLDNILARGESVRIIDFGFAYTLGEKIEKIQGTPGFSAPEIFELSEGSSLLANPAIDAYSVGKTLEALLKNLDSFSLIIDLMATIKGKIRDVNECHGGLTGAEIQTHTKNLEETLDTLTTLFNRPVDAPILNEDIFQFEKIKQNLNDTYSFFEKESKEKEKEEEVLNEFVTLLLTLTLLLEKDELDMILFTKKLSLVLQGLTSDDPQMRMNISTASESLNDFRLGFFTKNPEVINASRVGLKIRTPLRKPNLKIDEMKQILFSAVEKIDDNQDAINEFLKITGIKSLQNIGINTKSNLIEAINFITRYYEENAKNHSTHPLVIKNNTRAKLDTMSKFVDAIQKIDKKTFGK